MADWLKMLALSWTSACATSGRSRQNAATSTENSREVGFIFFPNDLLFDIVGRLQDSAAIKVEKSSNNIRMFADISPSPGTPGECGTGVSRVSPGWEPSAHRRAAGATMLPEYREKGPERITLVVA